MITSKIACAAGGTDLINPGVHVVHAASTSTTTPATMPVAVAAPESKEKRNGEAIRNAPNR